MSLAYLKWAGGKSQLMRTLLRKFPANFERYLEPFCGSAAMFFGYYDEPTDSIIEVQKPLALLNDSNSLLVNCHKQIRDNFASVVEEIETLRTSYRQNPEETYQLMRKSVTDEKNEAKAAALFLFVNKTCFNGLWRVNSAGKFNVPWNGDKSPTVYHRGSLLRCSRLLGQHASLMCMDFRQFLDDHCERGDFVFLDPPYVPVSETASFTSYTEENWTEKDTLELAGWLDRLHIRRVKFLMTNSDSSSVYNIFGHWNIESAGS